MKYSWIPLILLLVTCNRGSQAPPAESAEIEPEKLTPERWIPESPILVQGKEIYLKECSLCHDEGEESAPRIGRASAWTPRLEKGRETLIKHALEGFNGEDGEMPARGGTESLTDAEVVAAVQFIMAFPR